MSVRGWDVVAYEPKKLAELLRSAATSPSGTRPRLNDIRRKLHITYLNDYLPATNVQTIVVEDTYVDRDFLEDYAAYYARCFRDYPRFCSRLHFFSRRFDAAEFEAALRSKAAPDFLVDSYRGFVVIKPLPETIIGRTCLSVYPHEQRRHYPVARDCNAQLFGIDLKLKSLPFQEQDTAVARCATSALWSVFHATSDVFHHAVPTPVEITRAATASGTGRALPNHGLTLTEVGAAIKACSLEPHSVKAENLDMLRMVAYAYLRAGIPSYLSVFLVDPGESDSEAESSNPEKAVDGLDHHGPKEFGRHAVAVTGFSLPNDGGPVETAHGLRVRALRIDKLYVHDDGVGPFARMKILDERLTWTDEYGDLHQESPCLASSWPVPSKPDEIGSARAVANQLMIPLYHKIRVQFGEVLKVVDAFDQQLESFQDSGFLNSLSSKLEWDIFLSEVAEFRRDVRAENLPADYRADLLVEPMPRFVWRAIGHVGAARVLELVFDATDLEQGSFLCRCVEYQARLGHALSLLAKTQLEQLSETDPSAGVFEWFAEQ